MTTKTKTQWGCTTCGSYSPKWLGQCPGCLNWNTLVEEKLPYKPNTTSLPSSTAPIPLNTVEFQEEIRLHTRAPGWNRLLGGGTVRGSLTLLGGEPGIGKSTLLLQFLLNLPNKAIQYCMFVGKNPCPKLHYAHND